MINNTKISDLEFIFARDLEKYKKEINKDIYTDNLKSLSRYYLYEKNCNNKDWHIVHKLIDKDNMFMNRMIMQLLINMGE